MTDFPLLAGLSVEDRQAFLSTARRRRFSRREVIFHEGDPGEAIHLVDRGHVALRITTASGDVSLIRLLRPGDFFGELALISPGPRSASAVAVEGAQTLSVSRQQFEDLRQRAHGTTEVLVAALAAEVRRLAAAHTEALYATVDKRVHRRLLDAADAYGASDGPSPVTVPLTQDEIAQLAGTTRPTANQLLGAAQQAGAIALSRGRIEVIDRAWIERHAR